MFCIEFSEQWKGDRTGRPSNSFEKVFLIAIWYLSTRESFKEIGTRFKYEKGHLFRMCWKLFKMVYEKRKNYIKWPENLNETASTFEMISQFPNVIGCIDCLKIRAMHKSVVKVQAICDANLLFTDVLIKWPGDTTDDKLFRDSPIYNDLMSSEICEDNYHLLGSSAYPLLKFVMTPFEENVPLTSNQKTFNHRHNETYLRIKYAFAKLLSRFARIRTFDQIKHIDQAKYYVLSAFVLHNFIIMNEFDDQVIDESFIPVYDENLAAEMGYENMDGVLKREELTSILE